MPIIIKLFFFSCDIFLVSGLCWLHTVNCDMFLPQIFWGTFERWSYFFFFLQHLYIEHLLYIRLVYDATGHLIKEDRSLILHYVYFSKSSVERWFYFFLKYFVEFTCDAIWAWSLVFFLIYFIINLFFNIGLFRCCFSSCVYFSSLFLLRNLPILSELLNLLSWSC